MTENPEEEVTVDPKLAATGDEKFDTGEGLFSKPAEKPGEKGDEKEPEMPPELLVYPFILLFDIAAKIRDYDGWKLKKEEGEYAPFEALSRAILKRVTKLKDADLVMACVGVVALIGKKSMEDAEYHKDHPLRSAAQKKKDVAETNPTSPAGRKGARK